jgi:biotin carboxyl carrier protein
VADRQRFRVRVGEREHDVVVESTDDGVRRVLVDEIPQEVIDAPGDTTLVRDPEGGRQLNVVLDRDGRPTGASISGRSESVEVRSEEQAALEEALAGGGIDAGGVIKAPMPGRIVGIQVKEGDDVEQGAPVVIIEAMKMENELHAPTSGKVSSVSTSVGATVEAGAVLCEIEPHD